MVLARCMSWLISFAWANWGWKERRSENFVKNTFYETISLILVHIDNCKFYLAKLLGGGRRGHFPPVSPGSYAHDCKSRLSIEIEIIMEKPRCKSKVK